VTPAAAAAWLRPKEPVLAVQIGGDARAYPLQILMWHEIVNDTVGGRAVVITYCPLCNSGIVFDRAVGDAVLDFGTSGKLYRSDLVMYDRQSHSLWAQMEGRAIVGARAGTRLTMAGQHARVRDVARRASRRQGLVARNWAPPQLRHQSVRRVR